MLQDLQNLEAASQSDWQKKLFSSKPLQCQYVNAIYCKTHYYRAPFNFTHFALGDDNAYITGADIRST